MASISAFAHLGNTAAWIPGPAHFACPDMYIGSSICACKYIKYYKIYIRNFVYKYTSALLHSSYTAALIEKRALHSAACAAAFCKAPEYKKSPMPWGFHSTRLSWFCYVVSSLRDGWSDAQLDCHFEVQWRWDSTQLSIIRTLKPDSVSNPFGFYKMHVFDFQWYQLSLFHRVYELVLSNCYQRCVINISLFCRMHCLKRNNC